VPSFGGRTTAGEDMQRTAKWQYPRAMNRVLYQFPVSHYCEKVRWVLDHKGLPYRVQNQLPGPHARFNKKLAGHATVPLLRDGTAAISGSHAIALYLEAQHPAARLLPVSSAGAALHDELVQHYDSVVGPAVRRFIYSLIIPRPKLFREVFFREYRGVPKLVGHAIAWPVSTVISKMYDVRAKEVSALPDQFRREADAIELRLRDGSPFLIDDAFSLADITVASLYGPLVGTPGSPWAFELPIPELQALRTELSARPIGRWIAERYAARPHSAALGS
jgi:glutathione S-transferase